MSGSYHGDAGKDDEDYQLALKLSAELNGEPTPAAPKEQHDEDADFALAIQMQWQLEQGEERSKKPQASSSSSAPSPPPPANDQSAWGMDDGDIPIADYQSETADKYITLNTFAELTVHLKTTKCRSCTEPLFQSELDIRSIFKEWSDGVVDKLSCAIRCKGCNTTSCIACTPEPYTKTSRIGTRTSNQNVSWCCVGGRTFLIWALLCGFDRHMWESRVGKTLSRPVDPVSSDKTHGRGKKGGNTKSARGGGVGFGGSRVPHMTYMPNGLGYGSDMGGMDDYDEYDEEDFEEMMNAQHTHFKGQGHTLDPTKQPKSAKSKKEEPLSRAQSAQESEDRFGRLVLGFLTDLLPSLERETCFDFDPPAAILEMLMESKILNFCAELLRNDSLTDVIKRKSLYQTLFRFLTTIGSHHSTTQALFGARSARPETIDLLTVSFCADSKVVAERKEKVASLAACLRNLTAQSTLVLQSARNNENDFKTEDGQTMLWICRQISNLAQHIQTNGGPNPDVKGSTAAAIVVTDPIRDVDDNLIMQAHKYAPTARGLSGSQPGRFKRLITEITTLQTGLPPGIFVRYCENRPDVLKCAIIGPVGTPYENGIFEFDIFCDGNFPNMPPQVNFKGTGGGRVSINPNLYADGKVCLSLLGTWSGEPWKPKASTLLQVLISIQAMILCEEPWYNEPGREAGYSKAAGGPSEMYNRKIREHTTRFAILEWLDRPPPLWKDVVDQHFKQNGNAILKTVEEWATAKATAKGPTRGGIHEYYDYDEAFMGVGARGQSIDNSDMGSMLGRLQVALKEKFGATFEVKYVPPPVAPPPPRPPPSQQNGFPPFGSDLDAEGMFDFPSPFHTFHSPIPPRGGPRGGFRGGFRGRGQVLGNGTPPPPAGPATGESSEPRYETRSATRGRGDGSSTDTRGGFNVPSFGRGSGASIPSNAPGSSPHTFGGDPPQGGRGSPRGNYRGGRGGHGGRGNGL